MPHQIPLVVFEALEVYKAKPAIVLPCIFEAVPPAVKEVLIAI